MAKLEGISRFDIKDYPDQPWIQRLFEPLNESLDSLFRALRNKLNFADNIYSETKEFEFTHNVAVLNIQHKLSKVNGVILIKNPDNSDAAYMITGFQYWTIDNNSIGVRVFFNGAGTTKGNVRFIVLGA